MTLLRSPDHRRAPGHRCSRRCRSRRPLDAIAELRGAGCAIRSAVIDQHGPAAPLLAGPAGRRARPAGSTAGRAAPAGLKAAGARRQRQPGRPSWPPSWPSTAAAAALASAEQRDRLADGRAAALRAARLGDGIDLGGLYRLAAALKDQGAAETQRPCR